MRPYTTQNIQVRSETRQDNDFILVWSKYIENNLKYTTLAIYWNVFLAFNPMIVWEQISKYYPPGCEKFSVRSQRCDQSDVPQNFSGTEPSYHHTIIIITIINIIFTIIIKIKQVICRTSLAPTTQLQHHPLSLSSQLRFTSLGWLIYNKVNRCLARYSPRHNHQPTYQQGTE